MLCNLWQTRRWVGLGYSGMSQMRNQTLGDKICRFFRLSNRHRDRNSSREELRFPPLLLFLLLALPSLSGREAFFIHPVVICDPVPDVVVDGLWNPCRGVDDWESRVSPLSGGLVGGAPRDPSRERGASLPETSNSVENFRRHHARSELRLPVRSKAQGSFRGALAVVIV